MESLRARASSLFSSSPFRGRTASPDHAATATSRSRGLTDPSQAEKGLQGASGSTARKPPRLTLHKEEPADGSNESSSPLHAVRKPVRVLPAWVHSADEDESDDDGADAHSNLLPKYPSQPPEAQTAQHNHTPYNPTFLLKSKPEPGRLHDAKRESVPPTPRYHVSEIASRWRQFAQWSAYATDAEEKGERVTEDWLVSHGPDYSQPWHTPEQEERLQEAKRRFQHHAGWTPRVQRTLLRNPFVPLVFRLLVLSFSSIALALSANILLIQSEECAPASPLMAIIVDTVAIIYLVMITYDEYRGQPLGLRSAITKVRLIMLDLIFIVFDSANLSIAFESFSANATPGGGMCVMSDSFKMKQTALAAVLLLALVAWLMTFTISILRVVERVQR